MDFQCLQPEDIKRADAARKKKTDEPSPDDKETDDEEETKAEKKTESKDADKEEDEDEEAEDEKAGGDTATAGKAKKSDLEGEEQVGYGYFPPGLAYSSPPLMRSPYMPRNCGHIREVPFGEREK